MALRNGFIRIPKDKMFGKNKQPIRLTVSRTVCKKYQSKVAGFVVDLPEGLSVSDGMDLLDFMVEARLTGSYERIMKEKYRRIYSTLFPGQELSDFLKIVDNQTSVPELDDHDDSGNDISAHMLDTIRGSKKF